jgi:hypothetical protein
VLTCRLAAGQVYSALIDEGQPTGPLWNDTLEFYRDGILLTSQPVSGLFASLPIPVFRVRVDGLRRSEHTPQESTDPAMTSTLRTRELEITPQCIPARCVVGHVHLAFRVAF